MGELICKNEVGPETTLGSLWCASSCTQEVAVDLVIHATDRFWWHVPSAENFGGTFSFVLGRMEDERELQVGQRVGSLVCRCRRVQKQEYPLGNAVSACGEATHCVGTCWNL